MNFKECKTCGECKPDTPEYFEKDGRQRLLRPSCRKCRNEQKRERTKARPAAKPYVTQDGREEDIVARQLAVIAREWIAQPNARFGVPSIGVAA